MKKKKCCLLLGGLMLSSCGLMAACEKADYIIDGIEYTRIPEGIMAMIDDPAITQASPLAEFDGEALYEYANVIEAHQAELAELLSEYSAAGGFANPYPQEALCRD